MTCEACAIAEQNPISGLYQADCMGCKVRAVASSPQWAEAEAMQQITPMYRTLMARTFEGDWPAAHERIKEWKRKLKESNADASEKS